MDVSESEIHQLFVKFLDGRHRIVNFSTPSVSVVALKRRLQTLTAIPSEFQLLLANNSRVLHDYQTLGLAQSRGDSPFAETHLNRQLAQDQDLRKFPVVVHLLLRLRGGKGGFGSLLRGAATKAGQKKPNNFDACRDMSGRRLRHVNAEKKLEEWRAEAEERKLEKMAEDFIKKKTKEVLKSGKGKGGDSAEKYVARYREDSAKCMEEVERSVRESMKGLISSKRKSQAEASNSSSKRLKIWFGMRKLGDGGSDSEDLDEDGTDNIEDEENEKSVIVDLGSHSDSSKEVEANSGPITGGKLESGSVNGGSSGNGSEDEESLKLVRNQDGHGEDGNNENGNIPVLESLEKSRDYGIVVSEMPHKSYSSPASEFVSQASTSGSEGEVVSAAEVRDSSKSESVLEESISVSEGLLNMAKPINFDDYHSAAELEVLGLERLKMELQTRGLKCGGTLQERAARLFLLKTTPLEMLPKKLFAKK